PLLESVAEHLDDVGVQAVALYPRERRCRARWIDAGAPQRLVGVDVTDADHCSLIHDPLFDGLTRTAQQREQAFRREIGLEWLDAERGDVGRELPGIHQRNGSQASHFPIVKRAPVVEPPSYR